MVLQDDCLPITQAGRYSFAFLPIQYNASEIVVNCMILIESETILGDHIQLSSKD